MVQKEVWKWSFGTLLITSIIIILILWFLPFATTICTGWGYKSAFPCGVMLLNFVIGLVLLSYSVLYLLYHYELEPDSEPWETLEKPVSPAPDGDQRPFPTPVVFLLFLIISLTLFVSSSTRIHINYQVYGLILDGIGAILLGREASDSLWGNLDPHKIPWAFWGFVFLFIGFTLQILSILPWSKMRAIVF